MSSKSKRPVIVMPREWGERHAPQISQRSWRIEQGVPFPKVRASVAEMAARAQAAREAGIMLPIPGYDPLPDGSFPSGVHPQAVPRPSPSRQGSPVFLGSSVDDLQPGASSDASPLALRNPTGAPIEIDEIFFRVQVMLAENPGADLGPGLVGSSIFVNMRLGALKITNDSVPLVTMGYAENLSGENLSSNTKLYNEFRWRLPKALYVPAGAFLEITFEHKGFFSSPANIDVGCSARAFAMDAPVPDKICVPYVAAYVTPVFAVDGVARSVMSPETALLNTLDETLFVERFNGRIVEQVLDSGFFTLADTGPFGSNTQPGIGNADPDALVVRVWSSMGDRIVPVKTPFRDVFERGYRSWEVNHALPPGAYYRMEFTSSTVNVPAVPEGTSLRAMVAMVGFYERTRNDAPANAPAKGGAK
jgi:hypothetical protein